MTTKTPFIKWSMQHVHLGRWEWELYRKDQYDLMEGKHVNQSERKTNKRYLHTYRQWEWEWERTEIYLIGVDHFVVSKLLLFVRIPVCSIWLAWSSCRDWFYDIFMVCSFKSYNSKFSLFAFISIYKFVSRKTNKSRPFI